MSSAAKHTFTAGPANVTRAKAPSDGQFDYAISCNGAPVVAEAFGRAADKDGSVLPAEANAHFIAEAFTVAHETGLTPRQLAEQRDELLASGGSLARQLSAIIRYLDGQAYSSTLSALNAFRAAIAKAEGLARCSSQVEEG